MKICILTHSLHTNYGGLLQAYALQTVLKRMGHEVVTDRGSMRYIPFPKRIILFVYHFTKRYLFGSKSHDPFSFFFHFLRKERDLIDGQVRINTNRFIDTNINTIDFFQGRKKPNSQLLDGFDALIVGSDQVWRPLYMHVPTYFLYFMKEKKMKRIAYAASFGVDHWGEFSMAMTRKCANAAKWFDAISVREDSGVKLCEKYLGVDAVHVLDPTMLLDVSDYSILLDLESKTNSRGNMMTYILDSTTKKNDIIHHVENLLQLKAFSVMPNKQLINGIDDDINNFIFPSVSEWISGFIDAKFVITDSFHGCVFAIIFNKPFVAIGNVNRGVSRFISLLKMYSLESRLIYSIDQLSETLLRTQIDWIMINRIRSEKKDYAIRFLSTNLKK